MFSSNPDEHQLYGNTNSLKPNESVHSDEHQLPDIYDTDVGYTVLLSSRILKDQLTSPCHCPLALTVTSIP